MNPQGIYRQVGVSASTPAGRRGSIASGSNKKKKKKKVTPATSNSVFFFISQQKKKIKGYGQSTSTLIFAKNLVLPAVHFVLGIHFSLTIPFFFSLFKMANSHDRKRLVSFFFKSFCPIVSSLFLFLFMCVSPTNQ